MKAHSWKKIAQAESRKKEAQKRITNWYLHYAKIAVLEVQLINQYA